jgi:uncharacterized membrane protein YkvA (DUF1232 family)
VSEKAEKFLETAQEWVASLRADVTTCKAVLSTEAVHRDARRFAAAALNYVVTRLDLVPDHEPTIGMLDDAMVLRACLSLAASNHLDEGLEPSVMVEALRLANEADRFGELLDDEMIARFRKHCERLATQEVRSRTPEHIVGNPDLREQLFREVDAELLRMPAAAFTDAVALRRQFLSYVKAKLG